MPSDHHAPAIIARPPASILHLLGQRHLDPARAHHPVSPHRRRDTMAARAPFLNTAYSAYHHRARPPVDAELTRVGPGTPCGEYLRRFWQPVGLSAELNDLPKAIRIMGEDLVLFRNGQGRVGLLHLHCSHRGTSLEYAQIES